MIIEVPITRKIDLEEIIVEWQDQEGVSLECRHCNRNIITYFSDRTLQDLINAAADHEHGDPRDCAANHKHDQST